MRFVGERLKERSTWVGFIALATAFGVGMSPEDMNTIIAAGSGVVGLLPC